MKTYVKITLFFVSFIAIAGILAALYLYNLKHKDMGNARPDFVLTTSALLNEFEDDEIAATNRYLNKILEVKGTIGSIIPSDNNITSISLLTDSSLLSVICTFPSITDPSKFRIGDEITVRGECSGFLMDVLLNNCAIIQ